MRIAVPIAAYEEGTTGEYVARSFRRLGHESKTMSQWEFYNHFRDLHDYDLYFIVDSGGAFNLMESSIVQLPKPNVCFWMIDYRRGKELKNPKDNATVDVLTTMGGWVFQAQFEDFHECLSRRVANVSWLPLGADQEVWSDQPQVAKFYDVGFVGNVWDGVRAEVLEDLKRQFRLGFLGHGAARMQAGAQVLRGSRIGFNISSFFGEPVAFDVNMRVFETLMCGVPLVTNYVPSLNKLGLLGEPFVRVYSTRHDIVPLIRTCLNDRDFLSSGPAAREWAMQYCTYDLRMQMALATMATKKKETQP